MLRRQLFYDKGKISNCHFIHIIDQQLIWLFKLYILKITQLKYTLVCKHTFSNAAKLLQPLACQPFPNEMDFFSFKLLHTLRACHVYSFHWKELALLIQIPHPTQVRLKLPTPRKAMSNSLLPRHKQHSLQMPVSYRGQGILKFCIDWCITCREFGRILRFSSLKFSRSLMRVFTRQCKQTHILIFPSIYNKGHSGAMRYRPPDPLCLYFDPSVRRWLYGNISYVHLIWSGIFER